MTSRGYSRTERNCGSYNWPSASSDGQAGLSGTDKKKTLCLYFLHGDFRLLDFLQCMSGIPACTKNSESEESLSLGLGSEVSTVYSMGQLFLQVKADHPLQRGRHSCHLLWKIH